MTLLNRRTLLPIATALMCSTLPIDARGQQPFAPDSVVRAILADRIATNRGKGFVVAVLEKGQAPRIHAAGISGVEELELGPATVFEIGSITKVFTTTLLADMVARGEVKLDDPVAKYLPPNVRVPSRNGRQITLLDLATQTSGLPRLPGNLRPASPANPYVDYTAGNLYSFLTSYDLTRDAGERYEYSNLGIGLLAHALALRAGVGYEELLQERVLTPLGMTDTRIVLPPGMQSRLATGFNALGEQVSAWEFSSLAGAGALRSTVADMVRFLAANLDSAHRPLGAVMATARRARRQSDRPGNSIGLAWNVVDLFGTTITWHNGGTGGYRAFIGLDEPRGRGVVILTNSTISPDDIGFHLLEPRVPRDLPPGPPPARTAIALDGAKLEPLVGVYELAPNFQLTITREGASLFGQATGQARIQLHAESELKFFLREVDAQLTFVRAPDGVVAKLILHQGGANIPGKRVK